MKEIPLTQGYVALVDDEDYERVAQFTWHAGIDCRAVYAQRSPLLVRLFSYTDLSSTLLTLPFKLTTAITTD